MSADLIAALRATRVPHPTYINAVRETRAHATLMPPGSVVTLTGPTRVGTLLDEHSRLLDVSANLATTQDEPSIQVEHRLRQRQADLAVLRDRISGFEGLSASIRASAKTLVASSQIAGQ